MNEREMFKYRSSIKEYNRVKNAKDYIARKKAKSAKQSHKGTKEKFKDQFRTGGLLYTK